MCGLLSCISLPVIHIDQHLRLSVNTETTNTRHRESEFGMHMGYGQRSTTPDRHVPVQALFLRETCRLMLCIVRGLAEENKLFLGALLEISQNLKFEGISCFDTAYGDCMMSRARIRPWRQRMMVRF